MAPWTAAMIKRLILALLLSVALVGGVAPAWAMSGAVPTAPAAGATAHDHHATAPAAAEACAGGVGEHAGHAGMTGPSPACAGAAASCGMMVAGWPVAFPEATVAYEATRLPQPGDGRLLRALAPSPDLRPPRASS